MSGFYTPPVTSVSLITGSAYSGIINLENNTVKVSESTKEMDELILNSIDTTHYDSIRSRVDTIDLITEIVREPFVSYDYNFDDNLFIPTVRYQYRETIPFLPAVPHDSNFPPLSHYQYRRIPYFSSYWEKNYNLHTGAPNYTAYWNGRVVYRGSMIGDDDWVAGTDGHYYFIGERNNTYHRDVQRGTFSIARNTAMPEVYARTGMPRRREVITDFVQDVDIVLSDVRRNVTQALSAGSHIWSTLHSTRSNVYVKRALELDHAEINLNVINGFSTLIDTVTDNDAQTIDRAQVLRLRAFGVGLNRLVRNIKDSLQIT